MKLRVPDYYEEFACIADRCKDSCCIGWEIDIDEDSYEYYKEIPGEIGARLQTSMILTEDMEHSFRLVEHGRCPFLNDRNLCDLCIELGEEALCEVCTEYPRFSLEYGEVLQKTLSLSCEEVGRIFFSKEEPVSFIERSLGECEELEEFGECEELGEFGECEELDEFVDCDIFYEESEEDWDYIAFCEAVQEELIAVLQDRSQSIWQRMRTYLHILQRIQNLINEDPEQDWQKISVSAIAKGQGISVSEIAKGQGCDHKGAVGSNFWNLQDEDAFSLFFARFSAFCQMETLDVEWEKQKEALSERFTEERYQGLLENFLRSDCYLEKDYENLMVYFTFRYFMNCVYDYDMLSYGKLVVGFTLMIRDMDALRFTEKEGRYDSLDRIDVARIFSKEVEHSLENVELAKEEFMFGEEFSIEKLCAQI